MLLMQTESERCAQVYGSVDRAADCVCAAERAEDSHSGALLLLLLIHTHSKSSVGDDDTHSPARDLLFAPVL